MLKIITQKTLIFCLLLSLLAGCATSHINDRKLNSDAFPADFGKSEQILLVEKRTQGITKGQINRRVERSFKKSYSGKYEMASKEEIETNPKYADKNIYRYVVSDVVWASYNSSRTTTVKNGIPTQSTINYQNAYRLDYHLHDRLTDKNYPDMGVSSNSFPKAIKRVSAVLDKKLRK